jgi:hypothetical protein
VVKSNNKIRRSDTPKITNEAPPQTDEVYSVERMTSGISESWPRPSKEPETGSVIGPQAVGVPEGPVSAGAENERTTERSVAEVLNEHITLEVEGIDRMYLNVYVPQLQREQGVAGFFRFHRRASVCVQRFDGSDQQGLRESPGRLCPSREGAGRAITQTRAQGRCRRRAAEEVPQTRRRRIHWEGTGGEDASVPNRIYCVYRNFGPFFLKFSSYFPYTAKLCINGHEYS